MKKRLAILTLIPILFLSASGVAAETPASPAVPEANPAKPVCRSGPEQNTIVMLFTSDANSACNPALEWMRAQRQKDPKTDLWRTFVPVAMHVGQWDTSAHKDTRAKKEFDEMLNAFQRNWSAAKTYAPTVAVNGVEWSGWARGQDVPLSAGKATGVLSVSRKEFEDTYRVEFVPDAKLAGPFTLHATLLSFDVITRPNEGKNKGKTLTHDFIALLYQKRDLQAGRTAHTGSVDIKVPRALRPERLAVAFWVTQKDRVVPLQAAGDFLKLI
jgi:hypothetical protein